MARERQLEIVRVDVIRDANLLPIEMRHLKVAREIAGRLSYSNPVKRVVVAIIEEKNGIVIDGLWSIQSHEIFLSQDIMKSLSDVIDVIDHEIAHHLTGAADHTIEHEREIDRVSHEVIILAESNELKNVLGDVAW